MHYDPPWTPSRFVPKRFLSFYRLTKGGASAPRLSPAVLRTRFAIIAGLTDFAVSVGSAVVVGLLYHLAFYQTTGPAALFLFGGVVLGTLFIIGNVLNDDYDITRFLTVTKHARRVLVLWSVAFMILLLLIFLTKTTTDFSRATMLLVYGVGYLSLVLARATLISHVRRDAALGQATAQRVFLVGGEQQIARFTERHEGENQALRIVAAAVLRGKDTLADDLALAAASARMLRPDDVFILMPWADEETIDACVAAFVRVPAAIHLGPDRVLDRFTDARISRMGTIASLSLVRHPLTRTEVAVKRCMDLVIASTALILLMPFFLLIALAIKLDSPGPALFVQRRYGFNQETFRIVKFRSMRTMEDGSSVRQATKNDVRVTRVGRTMRRLNIDELPQLINVLRGDMSLVGPRPHALAHDQMFDRTIAEYSRRHNVKPGLTGWAQVNGFRGPSMTGDAMQKRVEHDLHYIDNWSLRLDIRILILTVVSLKAFRNAV